MVDIVKAKSLPVVIEAAYWMGGVNQASEIIQWILDNDGTARYHEAGVADPKCPTPYFHETHHYCPSCSWTDEPEHLSINTLEGIMRANVGDYIIRGTRGEFYPCKPDVFTTKYAIIEG